MYISLALSFLPSSLPPFFFPSSLPPLPPLLFLFSLPPLLSSLPPSLPLQILIQSVCETMVPKLVAEDIPLLHSLLTDVFPGVRYTRAEMGALRAEIAKVCSEMHLIAGEGDASGGQWVEKVHGTVISVY